MHKILAIGAVGVLLGCGESADEAKAKDLYDRIKHEYRAWERPAGYKTRAASDGPHGDEVEIFINQKLSAAVRSPTPLSEWPVGSIVVKEGYKSDILSLIPMMEKEDGGWFYAELEADGSVLEAGQPSSCVGCHRAGSDFLWVLPLP